MKFPLFPLTFSLVLVVSGRGAAAEPDSSHPFTKIALTDVYYSEGAAAGDIDGDGIADVVYGPYWFRGPDYRTKYEIYPAKPQNRQGYANHFFAWVYDFNGDGRQDVFTVGFPGTPAYVYENPGDGVSSAGHWPKHRVFESVSNESPHFVDLVGDDRPELVCTRAGKFGYATINWDSPLDKWEFHVISEMDAPTPFGHGLGVGDVNGDGRKDLVIKDGWFEQPAELREAAIWKFHPVAFSRRGGAEMHVYDVDGDGDNDVITSLAAHEFGLAWHEQLDDGSFKQHTIMNEKGDPNKHGVVFSELHSVALADMDGDGLKDIVTGKTYWSHHKKSPMWDAGAVVYWFRLVRDQDGVDWVPYRADDDAGIGRQVIVHDLNGDKLPDLVLGGMKGCHVLLQGKKAP